MAFSDPLVLYPSATWVPTLGGSATFRRVSDGVYSGDGLGTFDEPYRFTVKNAPPTSSLVKTRFEVQASRQKNVVDPNNLNIISPVDDVASMSIVGNFVPRSFTAAELRQLLMMSFTFLMANASNDNSIITRHMLGER